MKPRRKSKPPTDPLPLVAAALEVSQPAGDALRAELDIVSDILQRVRAQVPQLSETVAHSIEAGVRQEWGGCKPYVPKTGEHGQREREERDRFILAQYRRGESVRMLARRWGLSEKRIWAIIRIRRD